MPSLKCYLCILFFSVIICISSAYFYVTNFSSLSTLCAKRLYFLVICVRNVPNREHLFSNFQQNARAKHKTKPSVMKGDFHRLILVVKLFLFDVFYSFHFLVMSDFGHLTFFALCRVISTTLKSQYYSGRATQTNTSNEIRLRKYQVGMES